MFEGTRIDGGKGSNLGPSREKLTFSLTTLTTLTTNYAYFFVHGKKGKIYLNPKIN